MNYTTLKAEIESDPLGRGYATMSNLEVAVSLNTVDRPYRIKPLRSEVKLWAIDNGVWSKVRAYSMITPTSEQEVTVKTLAQSILDFMIDQEFFDINFDRTGFVAMTQGMVASGMMTVEQAAELNALANSTQSRAHELGLPQIDDEHVRSAREMM